MNQTSSLSMLSALSALTLLASCATMEPRPMSPMPSPEVVSPIPGACPATSACKGAVMAMPPAFEKVTDPAITSQVLNSYTVGAPGKGELCQGEVWRAKTPVTVYRLQNTATDGKLGYWWAFGPPQGSAEQYRRDYVICPEWNSFTQIDVRQLKIGALVAVGPGQSATCKAADGTESCLLASASNQVNTDWKANLEGCVTGPYAFPAAP